MKKENKNEIKGDIPVELDRELDISDIDPLFGLIPRRAKRQGPFKPSTDELAQIQLLGRDAADKMKAISNLPEYELYCVSTLRGGDNSHTFELRHKQTDERVEVASFFGSSEMQNLIFDELIKRKG